MLNFDFLPKSNLTGKPVLHFAHANGMPSRVYDALFEPLQAVFTLVYIPVLGEDEQGNEAYPVDNHWRSLTQQVIDSVSQAVQTHGVPVVGLGHSLGSLCTLQASYKQPELFTQVVMLDPPLIYGKTNLLWHLAKTLSPAILQRQFNIALSDVMSPARLSKNRRDVWASREEARQSLASKGFFKRFDPRTFDAYIQHGLTEQTDGSVTLTIPKAREVAVFRTNPSLYWLSPNRPPKVPATLIVGNDSLFQKRGFPAKIERRLSIPYVTHDGEHMFPLEYPDSVADLVLRVIDDNVDRSV